MIIYITGHDGYIGTPLCDFLTECGHELIKCDVDIREFHYDGKKPDMILHLAALVSVQESIKNPKEFYDVNVEGSKNIFKWAVSEDIPVIYFSSSNAEEWWTNPYAATKRMVEVAAPDNSVGIRPFNVYPGRSDMLLGKLKRQEVTYINAKHKRDFIHIDDFCEAVCKLVDKYNEYKGQVLDFGSGRPVSILEIAVRHGFNGEIRYDPTPHEREVTQADPTIIEKILNRRVESPHD